MIPTTPNGDAPLFLDRSLEEWWAAFLSPEYVEQLEPACKVLFRCPVDMIFCTGEPWTSLFFG